MIPLDEIKIEKARRKFWEFCVYMDPEFFTEAKWHLRLIAKYLQMMAESIIGKLIISEPPRAGKSYEVSLFHAWIIGKFPEEGSMRNSYAAELAEKFSYNIRDIIRSDKYKRVFPDVELKKDRRSVADWAITKAKDASYFCAGVGGPILGKGCKKVATLDDPIKNIEDALSETVLQKTWDWYTSTHLSRLESGCANLHVATRWSRRDPIGRILEDKTGVKVEDYVQKYDDWYVITIPALIDGKSFCEEIKTTEEYFELKQTNDEFIWEAEYMQNPVEVKGLLYPDEQLNRFTMADIATKKPDGIIGFTDTADRGDDYLCSLIGKRYGNYTYITDVIFTQDGVEITEPLVAQMIIDTKPDEMEIEANNGGRGFANNVSDLVKSKSPCIVTCKHETTNKETRILMAAGYVKEYFYFRTDYDPGSDYDKFMRSLTSYVKLGKNKHDDGPDAVTGLANNMKLIVYEQPEERQTYNFDFERSDDENNVFGGTPDRSYLDYIGG
jgi:predicted phage terminase large subunit-like protein